MRVFTVAVAVAVAVASASASVRVLALALALALALFPALARAEDTATSAGAPAANIAEARELFNDGVEGVRAAEWAKALSAFERSAALYPHATTTFNVGACERAMGSYTKARSLFLRALSEDGERPGELAPSLRDEATGFVAEADRILGRLTVSLEPADSAISVDGRPLAAESLIGGARAATGLPTLVAGLEPPGAGRPAPATKFVVVLNPGRHVFTLARRGFSDAVVERTVAPGATDKLDLRLDLLPATLEIASNVPHAIVTLDGKDLGPTPVHVLRPAGAYRVLVQKDGYDTYETRVSVQAGEESALHAVLSRESVPVTKKWWFWTGALAVVAGGVVTTYLATRPEEKPPPYDGGTTGWVVHP